jgi:hypothetical protein
MARNSLLQGIDGLADITLVIDDISGFVYNHEIVPYK